MFRKLLTALALCWSAYAGAQSHSSLPDSLMPRCGLKISHLMATEVTSPSTGYPHGIGVPGSYPPGAVMSCGKFTFYFEDIQLGLPIGYNDPTPGLALMRRNNLCQTAQYIESVFDFSRVPAGRIRIVVKQSNVESFGRPFWTRPPGAHPIIEGFAAEYIKTGVDPVPPTGFHGEISFLFNWAAPVNTNSDFSADADACSVDLAAEHLHNLSHVLGFFSFVDIDPSGNFVTPGPFSKLDMSIHSCPDPTIATNPMASLTPFVDPISFTFTPSSSFTADLYWINGLQAPRNHGINWREGRGWEAQVHIADFQVYRTQNRISPGDHQEYVMGHFFGWGAVNRKQYTKGDAAAFVDILGYNYTTAYAAAHPVSNTVPHSRKMGSDAYNHLYQEEGAPDVLPADYTIINNTGTSLTIDLTTDPDLVDAEGDPISIFPGSLVNFRGCGQGGNNHNLLSVNAAGNKITYTPRDDFYGRAQFGFNLFDGKETGGFVLYTIDVRKGSRVAIPTGDNLVLNGSFEEGTEVREFFGSTANTTNNSLSTSGTLHHNRLAEDAHISDCQPYNYSYGLTDGTLSIHNSCSIDCSYATNDVFGGWSSTYSFPSLPHIVAPSPPNVAERRYQQTSQMGLLFLLGEQLETCKRYELSFYARRNMRAHTLYAPREVISFGFTDDAHINAAAWASWPVHDRSNVGLLYSPTATPAYKTFTTEEWEKVSIPFNYCADTPVNVLYLKIFSSWTSRPGALLIDSVSIKELTVPFTVTASVANPGACAARLVADPDKLASYGCGTDLYTWKELSTGTIVGTGKEITVSPIRPTSYIVLADDGCGRTAKDTIEVRPCRCAPSEVLGTSSFTELSGTVPATLSPGLYYAATDLTVSGTTTFNNAILLMEPKVAINVISTAKLILDTTHIFTCPDTNRLWAGIRLQSVGSNSARIEVRNGSLIEDADTAINALNLRNPSSGNIIDITNSTFNRNRTGVFVNGAYILGSSGSYPVKVENSLFTARHFDTMAGYPFSWTPNVRLREELATVSNTKAPYKINRDYAKAYLKNDTMAYAGLQLYNTGNTFVPGSAYGEVLVGEPNFPWNRNIIDNMQYGLYSSNSNVTLVNTHIINIGKRMYPDDDTNHSYATAGGIGIYSRSIGTRVNRTQVGGAAANARVKLYDCYTGVRTEDIADVDISAVIISSSHTLGDKTVPGADKSTDYYSGDGIVLIGNNNHLKWNISQDTISNINHGMFVYIGNPVAGATTLITNNWLYDRNPLAKFTGLTALQYMMQGITVAGPGSSNSNTVNISLNKLNGVFNGIQLNYLQSATATVTDNTINISDKTTATPGTPQYGINALACIDASISANTVSTASLGIKVNAINIKGYYSSQSTNLRLCGNFATRIGSAFVFDGRTAQVGTRWIGNTINDGWRGMTLNSDIGDQGFMLNWRTVPTSTFYGAILNKWNGYGGAKEQTVAVDYTNTLFSKLYVNNLPSGSAERPTVNVSDRGLPFPYFYRFSASPPESILFPNGVPSDANCHGAIYPQQGNPRPELSGPFVSSGGLGRLVLADGLGYDSTYRVNQWGAQLAVYEMATIHPDLRDSSADLDVFMTQATGSRFAWLTAISGAIGTGDIATAQNLLASPPSAMGRVPVNNAVVITDYTEADAIVNDYRTCYDVHTRMLQNSVTDSDITTVQAIAAKCPSLDGAVVYKARALYQLLTGLAVQYKDDSCAYGMGGHSLFRVAPEAITGSFGQEYTLFPNPNEGIFSIRQAIPSDKFVEAKIYNALGQELQRETVQFRGGVLNFRFENPAPGLYLVCITDENHKVICLKFNVK